MSLPLDIDTRDMSSREVPGMRVRTGGRCWPPPSLELELRLQLRLRVTPLLSSESDGGGAALGSRAQTSGPLGLLEVLVTTSAPLFPLLDSLDLAEDGDSFHAFWALGVFLSSHLAYLRQLARC